MHDASFDRLIVHYNATTSIVNCRLNFSHENKGVFSPFIEIEVIQKRKKPSSKKRKAEKKGIVQSRLILVPELICLLNLPLNFLSILFSRFSAFSLETASLLNNRA